MIKTSELIAKITKGLSARQIEILEDRFGLKNGHKKTLAAIGAKYNITRERVRQIEAEALKFAGKNLKSLPKLDMVEAVQKHLKSLAGVRKADDLVNDLSRFLNDSTLTRTKAAFLFELAGNPLYHCEDNQFHGFYYLDNNAFAGAAKFISRACKLFDSKKDQIISASKASNFISQLASSDKYTEFTALNLLSISKKFASNVFSDFGLSHWEEINPKTTRARAYLVIKKYNKPLHFKEITDLINKHKLSKKTVYHQTVHNELIKDPRFVLVGRGTYALKEHGYEPGATKELIAKIIKSNGPLSSKEVVEAVKKQRLLKENTILINLQNRKHFKRLDDGKYQLA